MSSATGSLNTAIGYLAGDTVTTGGSNTFVGSQADANAGTYVNGMALGSGAVLTASNRIVLGNTSISSIYAQVTSITGISDRRQKKDIEDIGIGLDFIRNIRPVSYRYNNGDDTLRYGFIAQEVEDVLPGQLREIVESASEAEDMSGKGMALVVKGNDEDHIYKMAYTEMIAPLVKAVQEQQAQIEELRAANDNLAREMETLKSQARQGEGAGQ